MRVKVRRVMNGAGPRRWKFWVMPIAALLAVLIVLSLLLSALLVLLPWLVLGLAVLLVIQWLARRNIFGGKGGAP